MFLKMHMPLACFSYAFIPLMKKQEAVPLSAPYLSMMVA
ncbi:hypothetical protein DB29_01644 [Shouchella clausii]|nr:hypothetical protein DB29_01644 [Shouchella clausii]